VLYLRLAPTTYTAQSDVYVSTVGSLNVSELNSGTSFAVEQAKNLSLIATRERVLQPVIRQLRLPVSSQDLGDSITATVPTETSMILIEVSDESPSQAALIANAVSTSLINTTADLLPPAKRGAPTLRVQIVQPAGVPTQPSAPGFVSSLLVGLMSGLLVGLAAALALQARRERRAANQPAARDVASLSAATPSRERATAPSGGGSVGGQPKERWSWDADNG
jgi:capsular polysaccharide biosynthesis protein